MIKIAITKGRIQKQVTNLLENANYDVEPILNLGRELQIKTKDDLQIIFGKANDVITFLEHGIVDIGFVGKDTLDENDFDDYYELLDLKIGQCIFALASYPDFSNKNFQRRKRIASKYPRVTKNILLKSKKILKLSSWKALLSLDQLLV
jgi:ATP phosphoribosyltransferase